MNPLAGGQQPRGHWPLTGTGVLAASFGQTNTHWSFGPSHLPFISSVNILTRSTLHNTTFSSKTDPRLNTRLIMLEHVRLANAVLEAHLAVQDMQQLTRRPLNFLRWTFNHCTTTHNTFKHSLIQRMSKTDAVCRTLAFAIVLPPLPEDEREAAIM